MLNRNSSIIDSRLREYVLTGRCWIALLTGAASAAGAVFLYLPHGGPWIGLHGWVWRALGISYRTREELYAAACAAAAFLCFGWSVAAPWLSRRLVVSPYSLTIHEPPPSTQPPLVIPLSEMRDLRRRVEPAVTRSGSTVGGRVRESLHFTYSGRDFAFPNYRFRSNLEFEAFCSSLSQKTYS